MWNPRLNLLVIASSIILLIQYTTVVDSCNARSLANTETTCISDRECRSKETFLSCVKGRCTCSTASYFDSYYQACLLYVGGSCSMPKYGGQACVPNSYCHSSNPLATKGRCECNQDFLETTNGLCSLASSTQVSASILLASIVLVYISTLFSSN